VHTREVVGPLVALVGELSPVVAGATTVTATQYLVLTSGFVAMLKYTVLKGPIEKLQYTTLRGCLVVSAKQWW
jgi:hypothetical protein